QPTAKLCFAEIRDRNVMWQRSSIVPPGAQKRCRPEIAHTGEVLRPRFGRDTVVEDRPQQVITPDQVIKAVHHVVHHPLIKNFRKWLAVNKDRALGCGSSLHVLLLPTSERLRRSSHRQLAQTLTSGTTAPLGLGAIGEIYANGTAGVPSGSLASPSGSTWMTTRTDGISCSSASSIRS